MRFWQRPTAVRSELRIHEEPLLQHCGHRPPARSSFAGYGRLQELKARVGPRSAAAEALLHGELSLLRGEIEEVENASLRHWRGVRSLAEDLAGLLRATNGECAFVFTSGTTGALRLVIGGLSKRHRRIVTTDLEHPTEFAALRAHWAGEVSTIALLEDVLGGLRTEECVDRVVSAVEDHDVLLVSHVSYAHGIELPVGQITEQLSAAKKDVVVIADGAHGPVT